MKIKNIIVATLSIVVLASCGEAVKETTLCSCTELSLKGFKEAGMDQVKMEAFQNENKEEFDKCQEIGDELSAEMKDMSPDEQKAKQESFMVDCPAMEELQGLIMEQMSSFQNMNLDNTMEGLEDGLEGIGESLEEGLEGALENGLEGLEDKLNEVIK